MRRDAVVRAIVCSFGLVAALFTPREVAVAQPTPPPSEAVGVLTSLDTS